MADCAKLTGRTTNVVKKKASRMGLAAVRRSFTTEEIEYIKGRYPLVGGKAVAKELGVKSSAVNGLVSRYLKIGINQGVRGAISARTNKLWERSDETKRKISDKAKGRIREKNPNWHGGITPLRSIVSRLLWAEWKYPIMQRDGFVCQQCGHSGRLNVHHLRSYKSIQKAIVASNPHISLSSYEGRLEMASLIVADHILEDGITLCPACHKRLHFEKRGELQGSLTVKDEGNLQPSQSNVRNIVDWKVQRLTGEDSQTNKPDTSAAGSLCGCQDIVCAYGKP